MVEDEPDETETARRFLQFLRFVRSLERNPGLLDEIRRRIEEDDIVNWEDRLDSS